MLAIELMLITTTMSMMIMMTIIMRCGKTLSGGAEEDADHNRDYDDHNRA